MLCSFWKPSNIHTAVTSGNDVKVELWNYCEDDQQHQIGTAKLQNGKLNSKQGGTV